MLSVSVFDLSVTNVGLVVFITFKPKGTKTVSGVSSSLRSRKLMSWSYVSVFDLSSWEISYGSESIKLQDWQRTPLQDWYHSGNDPNWFPGFQRRCSRMFPERIRGMSVSLGSSKNHQAKLDRAPMMLGSVMYSSVTPGTDVLRDWLFLGCSSCVSLKTAANFSLLPSHAISWREKCSTVVKT